MAFAGESLISDGRFLGSLLATSSQSFRVTLPDHLETGIVESARDGEIAAQRLLSRLLVVRVMMGVDALDHPCVPVAEKIRDLPKRDPSRAIQVAAV